METPEFYDDARRQQWEQTSEEEWREMTDRQIEQHLEIARAKEKYAGKYFWVSGVLFVFAVLVWSFAVVKTRPLNFILRALFYVLALFYMWLFFQMLAPL